MTREEYLEELAAHIADRLIAEPELLEAIIREGRTGLDGLDNAQLVEAAEAWGFNGDQIED